MKISLITPTLSDVYNTGNRVTAQRYARIFRELGHRVIVSGSYVGQNCDVLVALHARKSSESIRRFKDHRPDGPVVVVLTGTDLYRDLESSHQAQESLELAARLVVLQGHGLEEIPRHLRTKARVIYQSAERYRHNAPPP